MSDDELLTLVSLFKTEFPYYNKHQTIIIDDDIIKDALIEAETHINKKCKTFRDKVLVYTAMHIILKKVAEEQQFIEGEFEKLDDIKGFEVGDIKVQTSMNTSSEKVPFWWSTTKYGLEAWRLLLLCSRSRIGLIV